MDILQQQYSGGTQNKKTNKSKKMVLYLLIICVVLFVIALIGMILLKDMPLKQTLTLAVNENNIDLNNNKDLLVGIDNINYISLEGISKQVGYNYTRGGYLEYEENNAKCYLENENIIVGFEAGSNKIFKTSYDSITDYEYFTLKNEVKEYNNTLYISLDDIGTSLNVVYTYIENENQIKLTTVEAIITTQEEVAKQKSLSFSSQNFKNNQAIVYGFYVVTGDNRKSGIVNEKFETIVGNRYDTIEFNEYTQNFIVSDDGKYGIINNQGKQLVRLKYESIEIINYSPLLYKVKEDGKFGILDEKFQELLHTEFNNIGINNSGENGNILIIKKINNKNVDGIVVNRDGKYGITNLKTGETILECILDKIFIKKENNKLVYYVRTNNTEVALEDFMNSGNPIIMNFTKNEEEQEEDRQQDEQSEEEQENREENEQEYFE